MWSPVSWYLLHILHIGSEPPFIILALHDLVAKLWSCSAIIRPSVSGFSSMLLSTPLVGLILVMICFLSSLRVFVLFPTFAYRGVARIFQSGGHTVSKQGLFNYGHDIAMIGLDCLSWSLCFVFCFIFFACVVVCSFSPFSMCGISSS